MIKVKVENEGLFLTNIDNAIDILGKFPELKREGVVLEKVGIVYFLLKHGQIFDKNCFFTRQEIDECLELVSY
tara:strand:- start:67584 stop:67802 length:219 start_codon:yes stop_codon:yes gene_type:complete